MRDYCVHGKWQGRDCATCAAFASALAPPTTCRIGACPKPAEPGELCAYHAAPQDPDLVRESVREADGRHRRIG